MRLISTIRAYITFHQWLCVAITAMLPLLGVLAAAPLSAQNAHKFVSVPTRGAGNPKPTFLSPNRRQEVLGIELAKLNTAAGDVPIAVTSEVDRLTLFWWDGQTSSWKNWQRLHAPIETSLPSNSSELRKLNWSARIGLAAGDGRVYLVYRRNPLDDAGARLGDPESAQVFVDAFLWDAVNQRLLTPTELGRGPMQLPLKQLGHPDTGYSLWAGWDNVNSRLLVIFQSAFMSTEYNWIPGIKPHQFFFPWQFGQLPPLPKVPKPGTGPLPQPPPAPKPFAHTMPLGPGTIIPNPDGGAPPLGHGPLVPGFPEIGVPSGRLLTRETVRTELVVISGKGGNADLSTTESWASPLVVDDGGYDFDARFAGGRIHVIHRRDPYSINLGDVPPSGDFRLDLVDSPNRRTLFAPLYYAVVTGSPLAVQSKVDLIPGGDHPQIQSFDPLTISVDRPVTGALVGMASTLGKRRVRAHWTRIEKMWLEKTPSEWKETRLFIVDAQYLPRSHRLSGLPLYVAEDDGKARAASVQPLRPVYLIGSLETGNKKKRQFTLLMQVLKNDSIGVSARGFLGRLKFSLSTANAEVIGWDVTDYSHLQIDALDTPEDAPGEAISYISPRGAENRQFEPISYELETIRHPIANTIGGALLVESSSYSPLTFFAYTDLGDGGLRVIFKASGLTPGPLKSVRKRPEILIEDVGGVGMGDDTKAELAAGDWTASELPDYKLFLDIRNVGRYVADSNSEPGSVGSGAHPLNDSFISLAQLANGFNNPNNSILINQHLNNEMQTLINTNTLRPKSTRFGSDPHAVLSASTDTLWLNQKIDLDGSRSYGGRFSVESYSWKFEGPGTMVATNSQGTELDEPYWSGPVVSLTSSSTNEATVFGLSLPRTGNYRFTLTVSNVGGISVYSPVAESTPGAMPGPPRDLNGFYVVGATSRIRLNWGVPSDAGSSPQAYNVYRVLNGVRTFVQTVAVTTLDLDVSGVPSGSRHVYVVTAVNAGVEGPESARTEVLVRSGVGSPTLSIANHALYAVGLGWSVPTIPSDMSLAGYRIYRRAAYEADYKLVFDAGTWAIRYNDDKIRREEPYQYRVAAMLRQSSGAIIESSWSAPRSAQPTNDAVPRNLTLVESTAGVQLNWFPPSGTSFAIAGYRIFRARRGVNGYTELTTTVLPPGTTTFTDATTSSGQTYVYTVASVQSGAPQTNSTSVLVNVSEVWDPFWAMMKSMSGDSMAKMIDATIELGKYSITLKRRDPYPEPVVLNDGTTALETNYRDRTVKLETLDYWLTDYRFRSGHVEHRFRINVSSDNIQARADIEAFLNIHNVKVGLHYIRPFTLGVMMADERAVDPGSMGLWPPDDALWVGRSEGGTLKRISSALAAKPIGNSRLEVDGVDVDVSLTATGRVIGNLLLIAALLVIAALSALILFALGLLASVNPITAAYGGILLMLIANTLAEPMIERALESSIKSDVSSADTKTGLDQSPLMVYAGEGLAEALARKALKDPQIGIEPKDDGRERYREQFWQMAVVQEGKAALWVRK